MTRSLTYEQLMLRLASFYREIEDEVDREVAAGAVVVYRDEDSVMLRRAADATTKGREG